MKTFLLFFCIPFFLHAEPMARHVVAFWDSSIDKIVEESLVHKTLEMPLNYLGLDVIYYDIQEPFPDILQREDVLGIIICFKDKTAMKNPKEFIQWASDVVDHGKKIILMRNVGFLADDKGVYTSSDVKNQLFERLGFVNKETWIDYPFDYHLLSENKELTHFELDFPNPLPGFYITRIYDESAKSYLKATLPGKPEEDVDLIIIGTKGAYVSEFYTSNYDDVLYAQNPRSIGWYLNPFRFFELAFNLEQRPIPDVTTLAGKRIFFSTCHGDSFNTLTSIKEYGIKNQPCGKVILEKVIKPYPDLPMSMGIIAADVDPTWVAKPWSIDLAKEYLDLSHVEAASHTYSHPFLWEFFKTGGPEKEIDYLHLYPEGSWQSSYLSWLRSKYYQAFTPQEFEKRKLKWGYVRPRAYANKQFDLKQEIVGAVNYINSFAPSDNFAKLLIWSGDSRPWDTALVYAQEAKLKNFGGGFVRLDAEYPSYMFVAPIARKPGNNIQLYEAACAENSYTNNWKDKFYGFQYLRDTLENTDNPRRVKPMHLYYHSYSGQFKASVEALLKNIEYIQSKSILAMQTTRYCSLGEGFYSAKIFPLDKNTWQIKDRKGLQTMRFDHVEDMQVDFSRSHGVIGYNRHATSLYVYLDAVEKEPIIALAKQILPTTSYLIESSWEIWNLTRSVDALIFKAKGWGKLSMQWKVSSGVYAVIASPLARHALVKTEGNILKVELDLPNNMETEIHIVPHHL